MNKNVLIHVRGLQMVDEEGNEPIEIVVPGEYYFRNGSHYLRYEELFEDFQEPTVNYIKVSPRGMEVRKKGVVNTHMVFEQGKRTLTDYATPVGTIQMGISATRLSLEEKENSLDIQVEYALDMNESFMANCCLVVQVQEKTGDFCI